MISAPLYFLALNGGWIALGILAVLGLFGLMCLANWITK